MSAKRSRKSAAHADDKHRSEKEINWAIKKPDSEPLLRGDIQHDVLAHIFEDRTFTFTAPVDQQAPPSAPIYLNFDQLYLESILSSMKTTQALRTKLIEQPAFAIAFCKVCLLINVGRFNTTLAFYPQMKTALRTYHPVPSLQKDEASRKDLQDAPRVKGILKACFLDWEVANQPANLKDIAKKLASPDLTRGPPTTVVNLIFHAMAEAGWVTEKYFPPGFDLLDIFYPSEIPSKQRADAFLSLVHHMLESKTFISDFDTPTPPLIPLVRPIQLDRTLSPSLPRENVDPEDELAYAAEMKHVREGVVKTVPAYQKRDEKIQEREREKEVKELMKGAAAAAAAAGGSGGMGGAGREEDGGPAKKRKKIGGVFRESGKSWARTSRENALRDSRPDILPQGWESEDWSKALPHKSSLPLTWLAIKNGIATNRDPDYDSEEEDAFSYDFLLRRQLLTVVNPVTAKRGPVTDVAEFEEWQRRKELGLSGGIMEEVGEDATSVAGGRHGSDDGSGEED